MSGKPGDAEEVLTVLENNGIEDAVFVSVLTADIVVLTCCVDILAGTSGTAVVIISATAELPNEVTLPGNTVLDDEDVTLSTVG